MKVGKDLEKMKQQTLLPITSCYGVCFPNGIIDRRQKKIDDAVIIPLDEDVTSIDTYKEEGCMSVASIIDSCAIILFPILYASFNVGYWVKYVGERSEPISQ